MIKSITFEEKYNGMSCFIDYYIIQKINLIFTLLLYQCCLATVQYIAMVSDDQWKKKKKKKLKKNTLQIAGSTKLI